jgi:hypothetical protein
MASTRCARGGRRGAAGAGPTAPGGPAAGGRYTLRREREGVTDVRTPRHWWSKRGRLTGSESRGVSRAALTPSPRHFSDSGRTRWAHACQSFHCGMHACWSKDTIVRRTLKWRQGRPIVQCTALRERYGEGARETERESTVGARVRAANLSERSVHCTAIRATPTSYDSAGFVFARLL